MEMYAPQTRRRLAGRQPLCGIGVTSLIERTSRPAEASERMAVSRPDPGPVTRTSTVRMPASRAPVAARAAACPAANGVPLREPRNPSEPELDHEITRPSGPAMVTRVLLNEAWMWTTPSGTFFFSRFLNVFFFAVGLVAAVLAPAALVCAFAMVVCVPD